jgi:hypothetical protein
MKLIWGNAGDSIVAHNNASTDFVEEKKKNKMSNEFLEERHVNPHKNSARKQEFPFSTQYFWFFIGQYTFLEEWIIKACLFLCDYVKQRKLLILKLNYRVKLHQMNEQNKWNILNKMSNFLNVKFFLFIYIF